MDQSVMDSAERDPITTKKSNVSYIKNFILNKTLKIDKPQITK